MSWSTIILMVWVFLVSIILRGWATKYHLDDIAFWVGVAFIIVRVLEWLGIVRGGIKNPRQPAAA